MASRFSYQRLKQEASELDEDEEFQIIRQFYEKALATTSSRPNKSTTWFRVKRVNLRKRFKVKIPGLRRVIRKKVKLVSSLRLSISNIVKRLKESQSHLGDLFAGNYLFLQVTPSAFNKCLNNYNYNHHCYNNNNNTHLQRYSIPRIAL